MDGIVLTVEFSIGDEIAWRRCVLEGTYQRLSSLLEHLGVGGVAIPALAHKGNATVLRHHEFQHRLLQVGTVILGVAVGDANGVLVALRDILAGERKTGRIKMIEAQINAFVSTDRQRQFLKQQVATIGRGVIQSAAKLETVEHRGLDAWAKQQIEGFMGKKLRR